MLDRSVAGKGTGSATSKVQQMLAKQMNKKIADNMTPGSAVKRGDSNVSDTSGGRRFGSASVG